MKNIPFNKPFLTGHEQINIQKIIKSRILSGDGDFTKKCESRLENFLNVNNVLLVNSCTAALEMSALILDIKAGDEIIMPSFTFVSSANAFVLRGGIPVFVDIRIDTLNIDEDKIENAITKKTKAILLVHYAGVACEMTKILSIAKKYNLSIIEDSAHAIGSKYNDKFLGTFGDLGTLSFHETKNIISGEGGALLINNKLFINKAEIIREKGTNRKLFFEGKVDKYNWKGLGSSYLTNEITAAFLLAQLDYIKFISIERLKIWKIYYSLFEAYENEGILRRPIIPKETSHNAHLFYILLPNGINREFVIKYCKKRNVDVLFHYIPLHDSPAGKIFSRVFENMNITNWVAKHILRVPFWIGLKYEEQLYVVKTINKAIKESLKK